MIRLVPYSARTEMRRSIAGIGIASISFVAANAITIGVISLTILLTTTVRQASGQEISKTEISLAKPLVPNVKPVEANAKLRKLLQTPITIKLEKVWLPNAILRIADEHQVPLTQKSRTALTLLDRRFTETDPKKSPSVLNYQIDGHYTGIPLRRVLDDLCRCWGEDLNLYWIISDGMIEIGPLNRNDEGTIIPLLTPVLRAYDVTSIVTLWDLPEGKEQPHPLVQAVLRSGQNNLVADLMSEQVRYLKMTAGPDIDVSAHEATASLLTSNQKAILIVRHNVLSHHAIEDFLEHLNTIAAK